MKNYSKFKTTFENRKILNKSIKEIISELPPELLTNENNKNIINTIFRAEDKTDEDIDLIMSKFHNTGSNELNDITLPIHIIWNNKELNFNLSQEQIMSIFEKSDLSKKDNNDWTILMYLLIYNKTQNINFSSDQIMYVVEKTNPDLFNNPLVTIFFSGLGKEFELTEEHIYKTISIFNSKIENIGSEDQEKINKILLHHKLNKEAYTQQETKLSIKL